MKCERTGTSITFTFDGDLPPLTFDATVASPEMRAYAEMHGWEQRLRDNAAIQRKQKDGSVITVTEQMRRDAVAELVDHYAGGATVWTVKAKVAENPAMRKIADAKFAGDYTAAQKWYNEKLIAEMQEIIDAE